MTTIYSMHLVAANAPKQSGYFNPVDITITRYNSEINALKKQLAQKEQLLKEMKVFETDQKIRIT